MIYSFIKKIFNKQQYTFSGNFGVFCRKKIIDMFDKQILMEVNRISALKEKIG